MFGNEKEPKEKPSHAVCTIEVTIDRPLFSPLIEIKNGEKSICIDMGYAAEIKRIYELLKFIDINKIMFD
jgi:hypothetical protein